MTEAKCNEELGEWSPTSSARWDRFEESVEERILSEDHVFWDKVYWATKVFFSGLLFLLVLCSAVLSKAILLVLTWNIYTPVNTTVSGLKTFGGNLNYIGNVANKTLGNGDTETNINYIWALFLVVIAPNVCTVMFCAWRLIFKKTSKLNWYPLCVALTSATLHSVGLSFFVFYLLPLLDPISGLWYCSSITLVPSVVQLALADKSFLHRNGDISSRINWPFLRTLLAVVFSTASLCLWGAYVVFSSMEEISAERIALFILSPILVSFGWWENFLPGESPVVDTEDKSKRKGCENGKTAKKNDGSHSISVNESTNDKTLRNRILDLKYQTYKGRFKIYAIVNTWQIIITFVMVLVIYGSSCNSSFDCINALFGKLEQPVKQGSGFSGNTWLKKLDMCPTATPFLIAMTGILASFCCHRLSVAAIKIVAQIQSFSFPICLATPVTFGVVVVTSIQLNNGDLICKIPFPWWEGEVTFNDMTYMILASVTGYLSLLLLTAHIWSNDTERMNKENKIFYKPMYCGTFFDQSLMMNRCTDDKFQTSKVKRTAQKTKQKAEDTFKHGSEVSPEAKETDTSTEAIPMIYLCATMWHETETEMTQLLKSLFRMDIDQCARSIYEGGIHHPDYYNFEVHIFFDDAFEEGNNMANQYVKTFVTVMDQTAGSTYPKHIPLRAPRRRLTPYGGRLIWTLPGGNKLLVHLKDKHKIRRKKRWSQVMYMYYFLSHKLDIEENDLERQKEKATNIFILALDGDVDFRPSAVKLLIDKMKRNDQTGAACGRIHPIGDGPMVWYQKFEYAVSHWLVKATEHITGCVLCSPGCFSLFRGSALMDCNVMRRYTTLPTQARHHIQYDQGEDRWLCTLLLKQGHKVDYCAASDAYTFAPEGFKEFYNQRRRWTPSTMANILDLLSDWRVITSRNDNVSLPYIALQMSWFISSVLTPGVLLLMIVGATTLAYPALSLHAALLINLAPVVLFVLVCFFAKTEYQLNLAAALSILYSLVMMIVLVGLIRESVEDGFCSIITWFILFVSGVFVIAGLSHPKETGCLIHGFLFFIAIPSMSMLLMIYSVINLNNISWGTREAPKPGTGSETGNSAKNTIHSFLDKIISCSCCQAVESQRPNEVNIKLEEVMSKLDELESAKEQSGESSKSTEKWAEPVENLAFQKGQNPLSKKDKYSKYLNFDPATAKKIKYLRMEEELFWQWLIKTYLYPGEKGDNADQTEEERIQEDNKKKNDLKELRNKASLAYLLINALFITIIYFLQQSNVDTNGDLSVKIGCGGGEHLLVEPISMSFTAVFGILMVIQFLCMIVHRSKTFLHTNSITRIQQDFDVDQLFMDVVNEILEKKREKAATVSEKEPEENGKLRLKQFIRNNLMKQLRFADAVLLAKNRKAEDINTTSDSKEQFTKEERKPVGRFKTLASAIGRMSSTERQKLSENNSFRQMFQTVSQATANGTEGPLNQNGSPNVAEAQDNDYNPEVVTVVSEEKEKSTKAAWPKPSKSGSVGEVGWSDNTNITEVNT